MFIFETYASENVKNEYIKNYIKHMLPTIIENISKQSPSTPIEQVEELAKNLMPKMAECQFESVNHYPKRYWEPSIIPVSMGESPQQAASYVDKLTEQDWEVGKISGEELVKMVEKAQNYLRNCLEN